MKKILIATFAATAGWLAAGAAHAGTNVYWSIGISAPPIGTVISNAPIHPAPVVVAPAPVVYAPPPVVYAPAPVVVRPAPRVVHAPPVVVRPAPRVVHAPPVVVGRPVPVAYRDRDRDGIPDRWDRHDNRKHRH